MTDIGLLSILLPLSVFAFSISLSPGPNNVLVLAVSIQKGWYNCVPITLGVSAGFLLLLALSSMGISTLLSTHESLYTILKYISVSYLLYLSYLLIKSAKNKLDIKSDINITFFHVMILQFINPKAWIMAISVIVTFADNTNNETYLASTIFIAVVVTIINLISNSIWGLGGAFIRNTITSPFILQKINISMGVLLAISVIIILL